VGVLGYLPARGPFPVPRAGPAGRPCWTGIETPGESDLQHARTRSSKEQDWKQYTRVHACLQSGRAPLTYVILRLQLAALNPRPLARFVRTLPSQAASFTTNTNWQSYGGGPPCLILQMVALVFHNFVSAATGIALLQRWYAALPATPPGPSATSGRPGAGESISPAAPLRGGCPFPGVQGMIQISNLMTRHTCLTRHRSGSQQIRAARKSRTRRHLCSKTCGLNPGHRTGLWPRRWRSRCWNQWRGFFNANARTLMRTRHRCPISSSALHLPDPERPHLLPGRMVRNQGHGWAVWAAMTVLLSPRP